MARPRARAVHARRSLAAVAATSVAVLALSACGGPLDRTDAAATAVPAAPVGEPGPDTKCAGDGVTPPSTTGFALPDALQAFDVLCSVSWETLLNGCRMQFSRAYIDGGAGGERLREIDDTLVAWSTAHGLTQTEIDMADNTRSYGIEVVSEGAHGEGRAVMTQLQWDAVSRYDGAAGVQLHADRAGIPLDGADVHVSWRVCPALQGWETPP